MANLFLKQAKQYAATRPAYPTELFDFIASKTPRRDLAWDVGTGSGQAAVSLAKLYREVVGTDTSAQQLSYAPRLPNVRYVHTPPDLPLAALHEAVAAAPASFDLVTVAQAFHWLDLPHFYAQVRSLLRPRHGVLAAWCYTEPQVHGAPAVDATFWRLYDGSQPYWAPNRRMVDDEYRGVEFPFDPVEGDDHTGPFEFSTERRMDLDDYLAYITSWSAYQTAKEQGVELLDEATVREFLAKWGGDSKEVKTVRIHQTPRLHQLGWRVILGMPESPRWLVMKGRLADARAVLAKTTGTLEEAVRRLVDIKAAAGIPGDLDGDVVTVPRQGGRSSSCRQPRPCGTYCSRRSASTSSSRRRAPTPWSCTARACSRALASPGTTTSWASPARWTWPRRSSSWWRPSCSTVSVGGRCS